MKSEPSKQEGFPSGKEQPNGHLSFIQESAEEEENARRHASLSANFRTRKLVQKTDKSRQEQKYHRKASDIQNRLSQASGSQDDLQGGPGQSRGDPRLSRDGDVVRKATDFISKPASGTSQHDQSDYDIAGFDRYTEQEDDFLKRQEAEELRPTNSDVEEKPESKVTEMEPQTMKKRRAFKSFL
jgi:hypothetical protein